MTAPPGEPSRGFTVLEVLLALLLAATAAVLVVPWSSSDRILENEEQAVWMLRQMVAAQDRFREINGGRSFGFLEELRGRDLGRKGISLGGELITGFQALEPVPTVSGYHFVLYLAGAGRHGIHRPGRPDPAHAGRFWVAYAWPAAYGVSGRRLYAASARGEIFSYENAVNTFSGPGELPPANLLGAHMGRHPLVDPPGWVLKLPWKEVGSFP